MEEIRSEESWNKKRIFAAFFLIILLAIGGYFFKTKITDGKSSFPQGILKSVKGTSSVKEEDKKQEKNLGINVQKAVQEKINSLKQEVYGLDIMEIASSSPQVQKILNDIKALEQYPVNQAQEICKKICGL